MSRFGRAWLVIARMQEEIARQQQTGQGGSCTLYDDQGRIAIHGVIDLPALAAATEQALIEAMTVEQER